MVRLNITMPEDIVNDLKPIKNKSRFIAHALRDKLEKEKKEKLEKLLIEGYKAIAEEGRKIAQDWEPIDREGWPE